MRKYISFFLASFIAVSVHAQQKAPKWMDKQKQAEGSAAYLMPFSEGKIKDFGSGKGKTERGNNLGYLKKGLPTCLLINR